MADISDLETLPNKIFEEISANLPDQDLLHLCQNNKNILSYCNPSFWAHRALAKGYIKNIKEFGTKEIYPKGRANERYLQLLSMEDCIPGSEKYIKNWRYECPFRAGKKGNIELINYFLDKGGDVNNALMGAAYGGHLKIIKYLIGEKGVTDLYIYNRALENAAEGGNLDIVKYLIYEQGANDFDIALRGAAYGGHLDIVKYLIYEQRATDVNWALEQAAEGGHLDIVKYLVEQGATNLNEAMEAASERGHMEIVRYLTNLIEGFY